MTSLRYARHVLLCWLYQLRQSRSHHADIESADIQREARKRLHRSVAKIARGIRPVPESVARGRAMNAFLSPLAT